MRFMTMVKFDESLPAGPPSPELFRAMGEFAAEGARNGTLVDQGVLAAKRGGRNRVVGQRHDQGRRWTVYRSQRAGRRVRGTGSAQQGGGRRAREAADAASQRSLARLGRQLRGSSAGRLVM
jgi:hypothetical protein